MTLKVATSRATRQKAQRKPFILAVGGAALAVALAGGIGAWQHADHRTSTAAVEQAPPAVVAAPAARVAPVDAVLTVNIVGTQEEKLRLERLLDEGSAIRAMQGERPLENQVVLVAATAWEADRIVQAYSGHQDGLAQPVKFNNLRARAAAPAAPPVSDQEMYQRRPQTGARSPEVLFIIVASEEAAAIERAALQADSDALAEVNLPSRQAEVVVVTTAAEEQRLYQSAADLRGDDGLSVTVIDLRTPADGARGACGTNFEPASCYV